MPSPCVSMMLTIQFAKITAVELFQPIIWVHTMPPVINNSLGVDTHTYRDPHQNNFKEPSVLRPAGISLV